MNASAVPEPIVLVPLDGSELAEAVVPLASAIARRTAGRLLVLTIPQVYGLDVAWYTAGAPDAAALVPMDELLEQAQGEAERYLSATVERLRSEGLPVDGTTADEAPPEAIVRTASARGAALIAMVTHGRGGLDRWAFGSVTDRVLETAEVPVLLVRAGESPPRTELGHLIVALDGSALAEAVIEPATRLARAFSARLSLVHVVTESGHSAGAAHDRANDYLAQVAGRVSATGVAAEPVLLTGHDVAHELLEHAQSTGADLVALTSHGHGRGHGGLTRLVRGSIADRVIRHADRPVLALRIRDAD